jgi:hypothetical protein
MHMNEYVLEVLTRERLAELRAAGEQSARLWAADPAPRPLRAALARLARRVRSWIAVGHDALEGERTSVRGALGK